MILNQATGSSSYIKFLECAEKITPAGTNVNFVDLQFENPNFKFVEIVDNNIMIQQAGLFKITWIGWCARAGAVGAIQFTQTGSTLPFLDGGNLASQIYNVPESGAVQFYILLDIPAGSGPIQINIAISKEEVVTAAVWVERM